MFIDDYERFSPPEYFAEYYCDLSDENKFLLQFYHAAYSKIGNRCRMLEIGGGPTIYQLISASAHVRTIVFSEYLEVNRREVQKWLRDDPEAFCWDEYFRFAAQLEGAKGVTTGIECTKARLRSCISDVVHCDLHHENPLAPVRYDPFDIVSSSFCIEGIRNDEEAFRTYLRNAASQVKNGGHLILAIVRDCNRYRVGKYYFPSFPVNERSMLALLRENGFASVETVTHNSPGQQGYSGIIGITAVKEQQSRAI